MVDSAGESYWLLQEHVRSRLLRRRGRQDAIVNNDPTIAAPTPTGTASTPTTATASTSDDVVSHEWGHAYTEYTSGLIYQCQSGALNESYSDVWGETLDLDQRSRGRGRGRHHRQASGRAVLDAPPALLAADHQLAPSDIAGPSAGAGGASFGPPLDAAPASPADVVVALDAADAADAVRPARRPTAARQHQPQRRRASGPTSTAAPARSRRRPPWRPPRVLTALVIGNATRPRSA